MNEKSNILEKIKSRKSILAFLVVLVAATTLFITSDLNFGHGNVKYVTVEDYPNYTPSYNFTSVQPSEEFYRDTGEDNIEAKTEDWISYHNPRDRFHPEFKTEGGVPTEIMEKRPGSGKICFTTLNEDNKPIVGETLQNTTVEMDLQGLEWHPLANPFKIEYPITNYRTPLDSDQIGTSSEIPQGDGLLDSHCIEFHLESENFTLNYNEVNITGEHSQALSVEGYREKIGSWNSDLHPTHDFYNYGETNLSDGKVSMTENDTHIQLNVVLRLNRNLRNFTKEKPITDKELQNREKQSFQSIIVYRNDDVTEATSKEFQKINNIFLNQEIPLTHAIVPKAIKQKNNTQKHCSNLRKLKKNNPSLIHYSLHGYNHNLQSQPPTEFQGKNVETQSKKIKKGVQFFQKCLNTRPKTFVPPGNTYDQTTLNQLENQRFNLISANAEFTAQEWVFNNERIPYQETNLYQTGINNMIVSDWENQELQKTKFLKKQINKSINKGFLHTQNIHYKTLTKYNSEDNDTGYTKVRKLINQTKTKKPVKHMNLGQLSQKLENKSIMAEKNGGWLITQRKKPKKEQ